MPANVRNGRERLYKRSVILRVTKERGCHPKEVERRRQDPALFLLHFSSFSAARNTSKLDSTPPMGALNDGEKKMGL